MLEARLELELELDLDLEVKSISIYIVYIFYILVYFSTVPILQFETVSSQPYYYLLSLQRQHL